MKTTKLIAIITGSIILSSALISTATFAFNELQAKNDKIAKINKCKQQVYQLYGIDKYSDEAKTMCNNIVNRSN